MKTYLDCIPCLIRQGLDSVRAVTDDPAVQEWVLREALRAAREMDMRQPAPAMAQHIHRLVRELSGNVDPYRQIKERFTQLALGIYPYLESCVAEATDAMATAVQLAIAGNVIDLGVSGRLDEAQIHRAIDKALTVPLRGYVPSFSKAVSSAGSILYLADNAGEIVFDRLLIEQIGPEKVTLAVRGSAVINDATADDAQAAGLNEIVEVIDNGSDAPGTILGDCSDAFRHRFDQADLIIAKGQGNYETLSEVPEDIFFVLMAKCPVIARDLGCEVGDFILSRSTSEAVAMRRDSYARI
jgi:uncharacterized protein with ATP-grasp and redox domains